MADTTQDDGALKDAALQDAKNLAAAARDRGMEQLEGAKGQLAEGAERIASAVERTANEIGGDGDDAISGYGRSLAGLMRQLAGGLRERDIEQFANELGTLARRNPGMFLAGSVALGFGVARFFKARPPQRRADDLSGGEWREDRRRNGGARDDFDGEESLDLSGNPSGVERPREEDETRPPSNGPTDQMTAPFEERQSKPRSAGKGKTKPQRSAADARPSPTEGPSAPLRDASGADGPPTGSGDSAFTGGTGGGALRGGKEP